jgi:hypothetical protein
MHCFIGNDTGEAAGVEECVVSPETTRERWQRWRIVGNEMREAVGVMGRVISSETRWHWRWSKLFDWKEQGRGSRGRGACFFVGDDVGEVQGLLGMLFHWKRGGRGGGGGGVCRFQRNDMGVATEVEGCVVSVEMRWERQ